MLHKSPLNPFREYIFHKKKKIENVDMIDLPPLVLRQNYSFVFFC